MKTQDTLLLVKALLVAVFVGCFLQFYVLYIHMLAVIFKDSMWTGLLIGTALPIGIVYKLYNR